MPSKLTTFLIFLGLILVLISQSMFIVDERRQAILLQLGQPVGEDVIGPGLHFKVPFVQNVHYFDRRILSVDPKPEQVVISSAQEAKLPDNAEETQEPEKLGRIEVVSGEPIIVDTFARYKITQPLEFFKTVRTVSTANGRLEDIMNDVSRSVLGQTTLITLLSEKRDEIMERIRTQVNNKIADDGYGIEIVDIRIVRADLTPQLLASTVNRMNSELAERATETRANGEEQAKEIKAKAEKEKTILLATAEKEAQILRGKGDQEAIATYVKAFNKDPEFYSFIRSMEAYSKTLSNPETQLILSPDSDFLRFIKEQ